MDYIRIFSEIILVVGSILFVGYVVIKLALTEAIISATATHIKSCTDSNCQNKWHLWYNAETARRSANKPDENKH